MKITLFSKMDNPHNSNTNYLLLFTLDELQNRLFVKYISI